MDSNTTKTPEQLADEARRTGRDAVEAAKGYASEAKAIGSNAALSIRANLDDAKATGQDAVDTAKGIAADAKGIAGDAANTGRAYAKDAVNAAGKKLRAVQDQAHDIQQRSKHYIAEEPVRSVLYAMAGGAALTAILLSFMRSRRY